VDALDSLIAALPGGTVSTHHGELAVHARDRWALAVLRDRRGDRVPPAVALAFPKSTEDVAVILRWAEETGTPVVTRGGATGRSGGAQAVKHSIVVDLARMNRIVSIDDVSQTVTVEAGVRGNELEAALARRGLTTGHDVGLMELSTVGGWIASASAGTASAGYGTVGDLLIGLTVALPGGAVLEARAVPRTGAGPDLRRLFIGSEGILGFTPLAPLRASRLPTGLSWEAFRPQSFETGAALVREIMQRGYHPLVIQLMDGAEAASAIQAAHYEGGALVVVGFDTAGPAADTRRMELKALARDLGARPVGADAAESWWDHRHDGAEAAGEAGGLGPGAVADSFDVAAVWRHVPRLYEEIRDALLDHAEAATCRLAHADPSGAALQFSFVLRAGDDREVEERYGDAWRDAVAACHRAGGTMAHHQGVGLLKAPFLEEEVGATGLHALTRIKEALDPAWILNPGKVIPGERKRDDEGRPV